MHCAASKGHTSTCEKLAELGADLNSKDLDQHTPMHLAAEQGHTDTCEKLAELGADLTATDVSGMTPLQAAEQEGHTATAVVLHQFFTATFKQAAIAAAPCAPESAVATYVAQEHWPEITMNQNETRVLLTFPVPGVIAHEFEVVGDEHSADAEQEVILKLLAPSTPLLLHEAEASAESGISYSMRKD